MYRASLFHRLTGRIEYGKRNYTSETLFTRTLQQIEEMPHPKSLPLIGTKLDFYISGGGSNLHEYVNFRHEKLGPIFYEVLSGNTKLVFVNDPVLIKSVFLNLEGKHPMHILPDPWILYEKLYGSNRGLFFMNGEEWLYNRRIMNKYLLREDSDTFFDKPIKDTIQKFIQNWNTKSEKGSFEPELESDFYRLSIDVIIAVLLGSNRTVKHNDHYEALLNMFSESVKKIFITTTKLYGLPTYWFHRLNLKAWRDFKECVDTSLFLAQKLVGEMLKVKQDNNGLIKRLTNENISEETLERIIADFIIAAGDTTAYTSLWTLYLMSKNSSTINELMMKEHYAKYIIKEAMRLYPVAPFLTRILPKDSILGTFLLKEGIIVGYSYALGLYH